jgi:hypothetical protein
MENGTKMEAVDNEFLCCIMNFSVHFAFAFPAGGVFWQQTPVE